MTQRIGSAPIVASSVEQFLETLIDDLVSRRSVLVMLPDPIDSVDVWSFLRERMSRRDLDSMDVVLSDLAEGEDPVAAMIELLGLSWKPASTPRTLSNLIHHSDVPEILRLDGLEHLSNTGRQIWLSFLTRWAEASHIPASAGEPQKALCAIVPVQAVLDMIPQSLLHLAVRWWWGFPSLMEMHLHCRQKNSDESQQPEVLWREHIVPSLAGSDTALMDDLWDTKACDVPALCQRLQDYGTARGWSAKVLVEWGMTERQIVRLQRRQFGTQAPLQDALRLWSRGLIYHTEEYGLEIHAAALALLGHTDELSHRLWRGQASLLLPLIDRVRLTICRHLTRVHGRDWPLRWMPPFTEEEEIALRDNPLACELGHLKNLLKNCDELRSANKVIPLVDVAHRIRNKLAHYQPVAFSEFALLWHQLGMLDELQAREGFWVSSA